MVFLGSIRIGQSSKCFFANAHNAHLELSYQTLASYMLGINISIFTSSENNSKWVFQIKVYFMDISIISLFYIKEINPIIKVHTNYKTYNNKDVAFIDAKINNNFINFI